MAEEDAGRTGIPAVAVLAAALILLPTGTAAASCSAGNRVDYRDAECLSASWKNRGVLKKSPYHVRNMCPDYGKVVAKVDLKSAMDRTLHLDDGSQRDGSTIHRIRGISCCSDTGALCNRSDVVTDAGCLARFMQVSPAARTCARPRAVAGISGENYNCTISAECWMTVPPSEFYPYMPTRITVPWLDLGDVRNCAGHLTRGPCGRARTTAPAVSVNDARTEEARGASLDFAVTLSRALSETVTVRYATSDGTARVGSDYRATSGTLTFSAGQTSQRVSVPVLDDDLDEGSETLTLTLSNPSPLHMSVADATATGTISNTDRMPTAWIARFGRTVAEQVLDAVDARIRAGPAPGAEARLAGQRIGLGQLFGAGSGGDAVSGEDRTREREAGAQRTVQDLASRLRAARRPGIELTLAGQRIGNRGPVAGSKTGKDWGSGEAAGPSDRLGAGRDLPAGSSFSLTKETRTLETVSLWGRGAVTRFDGREGSLSLDGEVASGMVGLDWSRDPRSRLGGRDRPGSGAGSWTAGMIVSHSVGEGDYAGNSQGRVEATLTGLWPWGRLALSEGVDVWGAAGYGTGELTVTPKKPGTDEDGATIRTDLDLRMAATGLRRELVEGGRNGFALTGKTDALIVQTTSGAASGSDGGNLAAARATVTRLRLGLEGARPILLADGGTLTPSFEIGMRHDGGDAETGFGIDMGGGIAWTVPKYGLQIELRGRGLLTHEAKGFRQRGFSGSLAWDPKPSSARGPALSLTRTVGGPASGGADALLARGTLTGLAAQPGSGSGPGDYGDLRNSRLEARFGYGFPAWGGRFASVPEIGLGLSGTGREYILGWRLKDDGSRGSGRFQLSTEARRIETAGGGGPAEHRIGARLSARW